MKIQFPVDNDNTTPPEVRVARLKAMQAAIWGEAIQSSVFCIAVVGFFFVVCTSVCGCKMPTEGSPCHEGSSSSSTSDEPNTTFEWPSTGIDVTGDPSSSSGAEASGTGEVGSSEGEASSGEISSEDTGESSSSTGDTESTGDGTYDANHCDDSCDEADRVTFDWGGTPTCYCAKPCVLESDCDIDQTCSPLLERCIVSCANGPSTCPSGTDPLMVCGLVDETPPYVQMCLWLNEGA